MVMNVVVEQGSKLNKSSFSPFYFPCMFPLVHYWWQPQIWFFQILWIFMSNVQWNEWDNYWGKLFFEKVLKLYIENGPFEAIDSRKQNFMNNVPSCKDWA